MSDYFEEIDLYLMYVWLSFCAIQIMFKGNFDRDFTKVKNSSFHFDVLSTSDPPLKQTVFYGLFVFMSKKYQMHVNSIATLRSF